MKRISVDIGGTFTDCFSFAWERPVHPGRRQLTTHHKPRPRDSMRRSTTHVANSDWIARRCWAGVDSVRYATNARHKTR